MATTPAFEHLDESLKVEAERICAEEGVTLSYIVTQLIRRTVEDNHVPFDLFRPNATTIEAMEAGRRGEVVHVGDFAALMADLHADD